MKYIKKPIEEEPILGEIEQLITRFEVIDHRKSFEEGGGRILAERDVKIQLSLQDKGKTLKVFLITN